MELQLMTVSELMAELGQRAKNERLRQNISQEELAARSGVSRSTLVRLEAGAGGTTLANFLAVVVALRRTGDLGAVLQHRVPTTIEEFLGPPTRRRASRSSG